MQMREECIVHCSFCDKTQEEVYKMIAGANVYICDSCITMCSEIMNGKHDPHNYKMLYEDLCKEVGKLSHETQRIADAL